MRKKHSIVSWAVLLLLVPALLLIFAFAFPQQYGKTYLAALQDKTDLLQNADTPKIVLIGGSGVAFNISAELLEQELSDYNVVNFGLYAGLGTTVMLDLALPDLQAGDIVVFSPETSAQTLSDWFDAEMMWQASEENPSLLLRLPARFEKLLAAFPHYAAQKARLSLLGTFPDTSGIYARASFTKQGDVRMDLRPSNIMPSGWDANMPIQFDDTLPSDAFIRIFNQFCDSCARKNVKVYYSFCPMNASAIPTGETEKAKSFESRLRSILHCDILGQMEEAVMDKGWFFDTNFHLNGAGTVFYTAQLAKALKSALGNPTPVSIAIPSMPGADHTAASPDGNNADLECFLYAEEADYLRITSLSESGKTRKRLTVPVSQNGKPVFAFSAETFSGNEIIAEITLQESIRMIPDGAFAGCTKLQTIYLLQSDPSMCSVGQSLLEGTNANIAVPADSYGRFCANYFWAPYAHRLIPIEGLASSREAEAPLESTQTAHSATSIEYFANGGNLRGRVRDSLTREISLSHRRENTLPGSTWFERAGYVMTAWNTEADGSGKEIGLGSRMDLSLGGKLYAQWQPCTKDDAFDWLKDSTSAYITGYHGDGGVCVLPEFHGDLPVRGVKAGAFKDIHFETLVFSPSLRSIAAEAFSGCTLETLVLFDSLQTISDESFRYCIGPTTLRVQAATSPVYSGSYFDTFQDKYDWLLSLQGKRKFVLASGSSGRYGYDSEAIKQAFPEWEPANMGVYAYTNALPQLLLMLPLMEADDVLLYAPEFDAIPEQFCVSTSLDASFWAMMESNYDAAASLDMCVFSRVFDSFQDYLHIRSRMPKKSYEISPGHFDDDGNAYAFSTYTQYGDFILPRPNGDTDERLRHNIADYTVESFPEETVKSLNRILQRFTDQGVTVLFSYTPRNSASLTEESTDDAIHALHLYLKEHLTVPLISNIEDSLLPGRYFWLIDSHTSTEGAGIRTKQIIKDLQLYFERSTLK
ncbi:MAG: leucine-rich repeat protein [Clostridia bacterium]|nr:leucine-rich repeat protein [Clostridia bacterium]